jgi:hypothetical protein
MGSFGTTARFCWYGILWRYSSILWIWRSLASQSIRLIWSSLAIQTGSAHMGRLAFQPDTADMSFFTDTARFCGYGVVWRYNQFAWYGVLCKNCIKWSVTEEVVLWLAVTCIATYMCL